MRVPGSIGTSGANMARRVREYNWSSTPLGPRAAWPLSLKTVVQVMLDSRYAMWLGWGPELTFFYNDAYAQMTLGPKHPWALGRAAREVWSEIWNDIGPRAESVLREGRATWDEGLLLYLERRGFPEETYHTFSYSPVPDDEDGVGGLLCVVTEDTARTIGERRLKTLRELAARTTDEVRSAEAACATAARILSASARDVPFALLYLLDAQRGRLQLVGVANAASGAAYSPTRVDLTAGDAPWPFGIVASTGIGLRVDDLSQRFGAVPGGAYPEPTEQAVVLPIAKPGQAQLAGFLVAGISPRRPYDDDYRGFLDLAAVQVATTVANARALEDERRRAEALAELDRSKTAFFSNVSHEFRTPLTLMLGPLEDALAQSGLPAEIQQLLEAAHRNGLRLLRLVNTLLDFSRIEAGRAQAVYEPTELAAFTAELASVFRSAIERAGLRLVIDVQPLPQPVFVDRDMWEKIVLNLLSNAFKFTFEGEIKVTVHAVERGAELTISDTGTGMATDQIPRLFERFHRVENARGRTHEGSGIGLALVQELTKLHGGQVRAESALGKGSTFVVTVPLGSAHLPPEQIGAREDRLSTSRAYVEEALRWLPSASGDDDVFFECAAPHAASLTEAEDYSRPRVLVADDNADMRSYITRLLAASYRVETVGDGEAALVSALENPPDLVLSDVMMPRLDGFGLLRELRADLRTRNVPVIMLSARAGEESRVEGMNAGADDYVVKPFAARELLARVGSHVQSARLRRETEQALRDADRRKDEFLATLSHELRNPLAPLRNALSILQRTGHQPDKLASAIAMMERQLLHMVRLVDDLLDVSRVSRGRIELRTERVTLASVLSQAVEASSPLIENAGHRLTVDLPHETVYVQADVVRLAQVFANLLNNAAKYTDDGGAIELKARRIDSHIEVSIKDNGIGIPPAMLPKMFQMFSQIDRSLDRAQGGLGVGLALVHRLVGLHGGTVEARSDGEGSGSEFIVRIEAADAPAEKQSEPIVAAASDARRVLVVDDNRDAAESLAALLELTGHQTRVAHDGRDAIEVAKEFRPQVMLLDLGMPKMSGYDVARALRVESWSAGMLLVALTGWSQDTDKQRSRDAGFDMHLTKPVDPAALQDVLARQRGTQ